MADGPTLQRAAERALQHGTSLSQVFELVRRLRQSLTTPILLFGYYNPIWRYGGARFAAAARQAGVDGVLCVDLPPEEAEELKRETDRHDLDMIFLLAPTSSLDRAQKVLTRARGFIYYVAVTGVTGVRGGTPSGFERYGSTHSRHFPCACWGWIRYLLSGTCRAGRGRG